MPYITEELWQRLPGVGAQSLHEAYAGAEPSIMLAAYPEGDKRMIDETAEWEMAATIDAISRVRNIRSEMNIKPSERVQILVGASDERLRKVYREAVDQISRLGRASDIGIEERLEAPKASARAVLVGGAELAIPLEGLIDFEQERQRLRKELDKLQSESAKLEAQLQNPNFVEKAPADRVAEVRGRIEDIAQRTAQLQQTVENLQ
jgi:valyl-tRNA synthetase